MPPGRHAKVKISVTLPREIRLDCPALLSLFNPPGWT